MFVDCADNYLIGSAQTVDLVSKTNVSEQSRLDMNISQICNASMDISLGAVQHIENVITNSADESWLELRVDQILVGCTMQMRQLYSSTDRPLDDVIQGYKALLRLLKPLFEQSRLAERASSDVLRCLTYLSFHVIMDTCKKWDGDDPFYLDLVCEYCDYNDDTVDDTTQVLRSLWFVVFHQMVVKAEHTAMISALLRLLRDAAVSADSNRKYVELLVGCLRDRGLGLKFIGEQREE